MNKQLSGEQPGFRGQTRAAVKHLPHGQLSVFPDCGQLPHVEHPDRLDIPGSHRMTTAETPPAGPAASSASEAYQSQAGHYDRRTDAFRQ